MCCYLIAMLLVSRQLNNDYQLGYDVQGGIESVECSLEWNGGMEWWNGHFLMHGWRERKL